jgi:undecaprenyl-diphosphatase
MTSYFDAALLGAIEGITEFLPISSTGHLILAGDILGFDDKTFEVVIQLGAILAICVLYFYKLFSVARGILTGDKNALRFTAAVLIAFFPAVAIGLLLHDFIKEVLFSPLVVAISLIVGGLIMFAAERFYKRPATVHAVEEISPLLALKIGIAQCVAMIPGVSRSGATIIGALLMGVERRTAAEFSFFLAIPTMFGASALDLWKARDTLTGNGLTGIAIGFVTAFIVAVIVVKWFVGFISRHDFVPFAIYRIVFGIVILGWLYFHGMTV